MTWDFVWKLKSCDIITCSTLHDDESEKKKINGMHDMFSLCFSLCVCIVLICMNINRWSLLKFDVWYLIRFCQQTRQLLTMQLTHTLTMDDEEFGLSIKKSTQHISSAWLVSWLNAMNSCQLAQFTCKSDKIPKAHRTEHTSLHKR